MPKRKSKTSRNKKSSLQKENVETTSQTAKIVLLVFGIGPLLLMALFLYLNGFFDSP